MYMKEGTRRLRLGPETLPSICFYTFLNAYQVGACTLIYVTCLSVRYVVLLRISIRD